MSKQDEYYEDTIVDILRHGEAEGGARLRGVTDDALTSGGERQMMEALAGKKPWRQVITSPSQRCSKFAKKIANSAKVECIVEDAFQEIDLGEWEGRGLEALIKEEPEAASTFLTNPFSYQPPGSESVDDFCERVLSGWAAVTEAYEENHILLVTHGGPLRVILGEVLGVPRDALVRIETPHACLTRIRIPADNWPASLVFHAGRL